MPLNKHMVCFTTYVFGWYQDFIPTYIYSILLTFPQHYVKVFLKEKLTDNNKRALEIVKQLSDHFEVIEEFEELDYCELKHLPGIRFLMKREHFEGFPYVYFGDVDFLVYNEFDNDFSSHYLAHCKKTGLPFSNEWNYSDGMFRLTGLHFIQKDAYFDVMDKLIDEMRIPDGNDFRREHPLGHYHEEEMLFHMAVRVFDLRPLIGYLRPLNGLHFGSFRNEKHVLNEGKSVSFYKKGTYLINERNMKLDPSKVNHILNNELFQELYKEMGTRVRDLVERVKLCLCIKMS